MTATPIAFRTNESKYKYLGSPALINAYAESQGNDAKAPMAVLPCAGLTDFCQVTDTPGRGQIGLEDLDCIYSAHSTSVYKVLEDGTSTRIGTLPGNDVVQFSRNQANPVQVSISCGAGQFYIENDIVKTVSDPDLPPGVISQDQAGGFTAYALADRRFFLSSLNDCSAVDGLDFATAEQTPDPLVRIKADGGNLYLMKRRAIEQWRNTGNTDFPFEPMPSVTQKGLLSANAVASVDNTLMLPTDDHMVCRLSGTQLSRISDHGIERRIEGDPDQASLLGFGHTTEGHSFYTLTGTDWTRSFDAATSVWHSRESYQLGKWRARFPVRMWGKTIFQDALSGTLFYLDTSSFEEGGDPIIWGIDSPILHAFPNGGIVDALYLDVATGGGQSDQSAGKLMLSWSVDGGNTWRGNRELPLGRSGDRVRVATRRLGRFGPLGIQFRIRISDPVIRALSAVDVSVRGLKR